MKRTLLIVAAMATLLAGCAGRPYGGHDDGRMSRRFDSTRPWVAVVGNKYIVVDQEPLLFREDQKDVTITWSVPGNSKYRFPKDGIVVEKPGDEIVRCQPMDDGRRFTCLNRNTREGKYAYTIKLVGGDRTIVSDPTIVNMRGGD
jgi:hypothetical protein